jgi:ectoine hydroxylase-related dioxygenase (phytanoyl-CoA dioxygenase family)
VSSEAFDTDALARDGYTIVGGVLTSSELAALCDSVEQLQSEVGRSRAGVRDVLRRHPHVRASATLPAIESIAKSVLGPPAFITRAILFDKSPEANWDVMWHQDVTIAVEARYEVAGFGPWSIKDGVAHVQPPAHILEQMVTLRVHLDNCGQDNGPLLVSPGSHLRGIVDITTLDVSACERSAVVCVADAGDVIVMRPLTLHASRRSASPSHRRVLHLEFGATPLPPPLRWQVA